ncbi:MAG TPA: hypothetical protein VI260_08945 [Blastocatellia bacterium]|jgi:hypothetical protein
MNCKTRKFINLCPTLAAAFSLIACEPSLRAKVDGSALPPIFRFYGGDAMRAFFITSDEADAPGCRSNGCVLWQIDSVGISETPSRITYGVVPPGFRQVIPKSGSPPLPEPNIKYVYHFVGCGFGRGGFIIHDGKVREW